MTHELLSTDGTDQYQKMSDGQTHVVYFKNYDDFVNRLRLVKPSNPKGASVATDSYHDKKWSGTNTWEENLALADVGWTEMTPKLVMAVEKCQNEVFRLLPHLDVTRDYEGETFDMGEFMTGEPEYWRKWDHVGQEKPTVYITLNCAASCGIETGKIIRRGSAMISLCGALELLGYPVQITVLEWTRHGYGYGASQATVVPVKMPGEVMDYPRVAYAMAHPAMLRRSCFRVQEWPRFYRDFGAYDGGSYGSPGDPNEEQLTELLQSPKYSIYFGSIGWNSPVDRALEKKGEVQWVLDEVKKIFGDGSGVTL